MRGSWPALAVLLLAACGSAPKRVSPSAPAPRATVAAPTRSPPSTVANAACAPTRVHRDSDYTPGGLYAPGVSDGGPATAIDVSAVLEPVPRLEPRSRYGNRSPYTVLGKSYRVLDSSQGYRERGLASWYGTKFNGRATSSGELYDMCVFSAAHKTLPLPSFVRVTNLDNGRSLVVRVNDRGPFHAGRVMDLSYAAAVRLGVDRTGTARVELQALDGDRDAPPARIAELPAPAPAARPMTAAPFGELHGSRVVQVGSFGEKSNAMRLADRLRDAGVDRVELDRVEVVGKDVWRVRIGPVDAERLRELLSQLRQLNLPDPRVLSE